MSGPRPRPRTPAAAVWEAMASYAGYGYGEPVAYAERLPGIPAGLVSIGRPGRTVCCPLVEGVVLGAASRVAIPDWTPALHDRAMAGSLEHPDPWGPVEAYVAAHLAELVDPADLAGGRWPDWTVIQAWERDPLKVAPGPADPATGKPRNFGHTMLGALRRGEGPQARVLLLNASSLITPPRGGVGWIERPGQSGVPLPAMGPPVLAPPASWWEWAASWANVQRWRPVMRACALLVG